MSDDDSYVDPPGFEAAGPEDWQGYYEEELMDAYYSLTEGFGSRGFPIFDKLSFHDFVSFAYDKSSKWKCCK
jgi:hypothetical protein